MRLVLFGPPGAGKGTQAVRLSEQLGLCQISTGQLIRDAIREGNLAGADVRSYVEKGQLVPDAVVRRLAEAAICDCKFENFILDGFPRNVDQAQWLHTFLEAWKAPLDAVIDLEVPDEVIVRRLSGRRIHKLTGESYHVDTNPPPPDVPAHLIVHRADDCPDAVRRRLKVYREETLPVLTYYRSLGLVFDVASTGSIPAITARIVDLLASEPAQLSVA